MFRWLTSRRKKGKRTTAPGPTQPIAKTRSKAGDHFPNTAALPSHNGIVGWGLDPFLPGGDAARATPKPSPSDSLPTPSSDSLHSAPPASPAASSSDYSSGSSNYSGGGGSDGGGF